LFDDESILITGATGSLGNALVETLLESSNARRIIVFSRDELKQHEMRIKFSNNSRLRWFLGDIRDLQRLKLAFKGVDSVVHAAALKQVDAGEYNPMEFVKTNVIGTQNVIDAAISENVKKVIGLSTDKASSPVNLYGATKLTGDKLLISANSYSKPQGTVFSVVRYGNVLGSRGSVISFFRSFAEMGKPIPITDLRMTRFAITINQAVDFVLNNLQEMQGGELYVPKLPSIKIVDLIQAIAPDTGLVTIGIRPGEKLHEEMISMDDSRRALDLGRKYVVSPVIASWGFVLPEGKQLEEGFSYQSNSNDKWLNVEEIRELLEIERHFP
jgi:UDP-N-acetylglucosamine 4,6-dehydratase